MDAGTALDTNSTLIICAIVGYFLGSIPFGLVLTRLFGYGDIRKVGSGNIGATNVLRATGSKTLTIFTILLDAFKAGFAAIVGAYIAYHYMDSVQEQVRIISYNHTTNMGTIASLTAGFFAILGHNFPVWLKFKGGKGVASGFGLILVLTPTVAILALATWIIVAVVTRYSSLSAIIAATLTPVYAWFFAGAVYTFFYLPIVILILVRHHTNFKRLFKGEETKITFKKK